MLSEAVDAYGFIERMPCGEKQSFSTEAGVADTEKRKEKNKDNAIFPVVMRLGDTPVLISNTMVKT